jgi:hypothetical protein
MKLSVLCITCIPFWNLYTTMFLWANNSEFYSQMPSSNLGRNIGNLYGQLSLFSSVLGWLWKYPRRIWPIIGNCVQRILQYLVLVVIYIHVSLLLTNYTCRNTQWKAGSLDFHLKLSYRRGIKKNLFLHTIDPLQLSVFATHGFPSGPF